MTTIFEKLREEHDKTRTLLDLVSKTHGDSRGRRELFERLAKELEVHASAEEVSFYKPLLGSGAHSKATHGTHEHEEARELIEELRTMDYSSPAWIGKFETLKESVLHHLDEEEHSLFQQAGKQLTEQQKEDLVRTHMKRRDQIA